LPKQGLPGYKVGNELLIAYKVEAEGQALKMQKPQFSFKIADKQGRCTNRKLEEGYDDIHRTIDFGFDASYQCSVEMTRG